MAHAFEEIQTAVRWPNTVIHDDKIHIYRHVAAHKMLLFRTHTFEQWGDTDHVLVNSVMLLKRVYVWSTN